MNNIEIKDIDVRVSEHCPTEITISAQVYLNTPINTINVNLNVKDLKKRDPCNAEKFIFSIGD